MKYDDASWHYGGDFPGDLSQKSGATHIGMFLAWCLLNNLGRNEHEDLLKSFKNREVTPGQYFIQNCDEKLTDEDLNREGNAFAGTYYEDADGDINYMTDYIQALDPDGKLPSVYHIKDNWENYQILAPYVERAYAAWKSSSPSLLNPADRFFTVCDELGDKLKALGYKYAKSGPHVSRRKDGFAFKIEFMEERDYAFLNLIINVRSRKLKEWKEEAGVPNLNDSVIFGGVSQILLHDNPDVGWSLEQGEGEILTIIEERIHPFFERFSDVRSLIPDVIAMRYPKWEIMGILEFLLCFGSHEDAWNAAIHFLRQHAELCYDYELLTTITEATAWYRTKGQDGQKNWHMHHIISNSATSR